MNRWFSIYLDLARIAACLVVAASHFAHTRYSGGGLEWIRRFDLGSDAVVVFFVLSGFLIAHSAFKKGRTASDYAKARFSRIYSVALPAILFTICLDQLGIAMNPALYNLPFYEASPIWTKLLTGITFTSQLHDTNLRLGTNGPYWSIAYESWYYVAFGLVFFARGWWRIISLVCVAGLVGLPILLLSGCWLIGVGLYMATKTRQMTQIPNIVTKLMIFAPIAAYSLCLCLDVPNTLQELTLTVTGLNTTAPLGYSDGFIWNSLISMLFAIHLAGLYTLFQNCAQRTVWFEAPIRWLAGATFTIYLFHYPMLNFIASLPGYDAMNTSHAVGMAVSILVICLLIAEVTERRLQSYRNLTDSIFARGNAMFAKVIKPQSPDLSANTAS